MNERMKRLRRFYSSILVSSEAPFTYYSIGSGNVETDIYYGNKTNIKVPSSLGGSPVTSIGSTTFSTGKLKTEEFEKDDIRSTITTITFSSGIEKI